MGILNFRLTGHPSSYRWLFLASQLGRTFWGEDGAINLRYQTLTVADQPEVGVGGGTFGLVISVGDFPEKND